ncbi:terpenoid synthase [Schizopora paradoxa]|uniref:Terpene synthase n=1 Tax=Schizopora paradoxa TaxID=27342 RepID=A0A0H2RUB1_9AGAM|nr:terpenoid synthase [Schizopora paradoxa]
MSTTRSLVLPDLITTCPFKASIHPEYKRARSESTAWVRSFGALTGRKGSLFHLNNLELLVSLAHPTSGYEELRICCDWNAVFFVYDELSDILQGEDARKLGDSFLKALGGEYTDGSAVSDMTRDLRGRMSGKATLNCQMRFSERCSNYINAVSKEAELREDADVLDTESYIKLRRQNSGVEPSYALIEYVHGLDLPDEVFKNPVFTRLYWLGVDLVCLANDLYSFSVERAKGLDGNNFLSVVMRERGLNMQEAADLTGEEIMRRVNDFVGGQKDLPSFGEAVDKEVQEYMLSIGQWHIANVVWSLETPRYFGAEREEVKRTLIVNVKDQGEGIDDNII